jgi:hypothetical protein
MGDDKSEGRKREREREREDGKRRDWMDGRMV